MNTFSQKIISLRWPIIFVFVSVTLIFAAQLPKAEMNPDMLTYMPEDMPSRVNKSRIEELFGGSEMIMILVEADDVLKEKTLTRVKHLSKEMNNIKGVDKVLSLFDLKRIRGEDGALIVEPVVSRIPKSNKDRERLRSDIRENDLVFGQVVSRDFGLTAVIGMVETGVSDERLLADINKLILDNPGEEKISIGGTPYSRYNTGLNTKKDLARLLPIGLLVMLIFLFICFRQLRGIFLPFLVVTMAILFAMGLIAPLGWEMTAVTVILPVLLIAVANDYGIHMIAKYQEDNTAGSRHTKEELAGRMLHSLGLPILLAGLTTMVGMYCLQGHILIPAGQLGVLAAAGIGFALAASLFFIPAVVSLLPKPKPLESSVQGTQKRHPLERMLADFGRLVTARPRRVILGSLLFAGLTGIGCFFVVVNTDPINYYTKNHPVAASAQLINRELGGFFPLSVVFRGDIKDPKILRKIDRLEGRLQQIPEVGNTQSITRVIRQISRALNKEGEEGYNAIPETRRAAAQYFELYSMGGDPEDFEKMVDFPYEHAVVTARINTSSTPVLRRVVKEVRSMVADDPDIAFVGGISDVFSDLSVKMVGGQFLSLGIALLAVALLLVVLFRSFQAGLIASLPLCLSMLVLFGLMGFLGIELNMATALLSSIMIGVGIDYTIHYLYRYREERAAGLAPAQAARHTLLTTGRGIIFNALSVVVGFSVLLFSSFVPVRFFGFLVVVSILACLMGALVFIPALCLILKPAFLEPRKTSLAAGYKMNEFPMKEEA
jgi:hydrophobe/amphiphile efflux-3 (HAE3) family protein